MSDDGKGRLPVGRAWCVAAVAGLAVTLSGCNGGGSAGSASAAGSSAAPASSTAPSTAPATGPSGPACAPFAADGPGSLENVGTAAGASRNPHLSTLASALTAATLVDTLNSTGNITVLAPSNSAFQALPPGSLKQLMADVPRLTAVLTHHVIPGRLGPARVAGRHPTLDNDTVTITGSGSTLTISGDQTLTGQPAHVVCGGIPTSNATVYVIDQVLKPQHLG